MNIWVASLGKNSTLNLSTKSVKGIAGEFFGEQNELSVFQYSMKNVEYFSVTINNAPKFQYNQEVENKLFAYSGFPVPRGEDYPDLRSVQNWKHYLTPLPDAAKHLMGHFAVLKADEFSFECIVDNLGFQKVYYHESEENVLVSNHLPFIKAFLKPEINETFYLQFLAAGGIVGDATQHKHIQTLTEYGWLQWNLEKGLTLKTYKDLTNMLADERDRDAILNRMLNEYNNATNYLVDYYDLIVPLSGGFDSRTVLSMFWNKDKSNVQCYNYPDQPQDRRLAKKVAKNHNVHLNLLKPETFPTLEELFNHEKKITYSFFDFSDVFTYLFHQEIGSLFLEKPTVVISGNAGGTHYGMELQKRLSDEPLPLDLTITEFVQSSINQPHLTEEGYKFLKKSLTDYYLEKYIPKLNRDTASLDFLSLFFFLERVGSYKGQQLQEKHRDRLFYMPFGSETFIQLINSTPKKDRVRGKEGGIHHTILSYFTGNQDRKIRFVNNYHWEAGNLRRLQFYLEKRYLDEKITETKFSTEMRTKIFEDNREKLFDILTSHNNSFLWDYFRKDYFSKLATGKNKINYSDIQIILKIAPLLLSQNNK
jgi:hypothetical protein